MVTRYTPGGCHDHTTRISRTARSDPRHPVPLSDLSPRTHHEPRRRPHFYIWGDVARFCADCAREKDLHNWLEEKTTVLSTLARMLAGREGVLKEMDLSLIVDVV